MKDFPARIAYLDDEQDLREIVRLTLEGAGFDGALATCGSGRELMQRLRVLQPELILLDLRMPDMDGPDVLDALNKSDEGKNVPIILTTGALKLEMLELYKSLGVIGVIHKPLDLDDLVENIRDLWLGHLEKTSA